MPGSKIPKFPVRKSLEALVAKQAKEAAQESFMYDLDSRPDADSEQGTNGRLSWGSRGDVGLSREHNEDSYLCLPPLFAVSDGMGGEAAGEIASSICIQTLAENAPTEANAEALGEAIEAANQAIIEAPAKGVGKEGMGCTATAVLIENDKMALAHVGDSRCYLLHNQSLVRLTRDHSFVETLIEAGLITAEEARVHPKRSIITRALGSDPDMYADNLTIDVEKGERVLLCSDGLSSMITDAEIEKICQENKTPQLCADALVSAALAAGGSDNVTVIVVDILNDGKEAIMKKKRHKAIMSWMAGVISLLVALCCVGVWFVDESYYLAPDEESPQKVAIYQGFNSSFLGIPLSHITEKTEVNISDLTPDTQKQLQSGVLAMSEADAQEKVQRYLSHIATKKAEAHEAASDATATTNTDAAAMSGTDTNVALLIDPNNPSTMASISDGEGGGQ